MSRSGSKITLSSVMVSCLGNGQTNPRASYAFIFRPVELVGADPVTYGTVSFRLEGCGPKDDRQLQTSNRGELRAGITAIQFRCWLKESFKRLMIAMDSEYGVKGATDWIQGWQPKGWVTAKKEPVKSRDLWELLLKDVWDHAAVGVEVLLWIVPREQNREADEAAKKAAELDEMPKFVRYICMMKGPNEMATIMLPLEEAN